MREQEKSLQKAMRIFEALAGVDEELLDACNQQEVQGKKAIPFGKYGRIVAACFCLVVAGVLLWTASVTGGFRSAKSWDSEAVSKVEQMSDSFSKGEVMEEGLKENCGVQEESVFDQELEAAQWELSEQSCATSVPVDKREKLNLQTARQLDIYGAFIPGKLPQGYSFESGYRIQNPTTKETTGVCLNWTKGLDCISWIVKKADGKDVLCIDPGDREAYDVNLYEIPYADTVPEEYRETFHNPVFKEKELSLELVKSRMKVVQDAGDTDTPRGNFSVFYEEGILVEFRGDGTAEEIWNLFTSLQD